MKKRMSGVPQSLLILVCTLPSSFCWGEGGEVGVSFLPIFQKDGGGGGGGGLDRISIFRGGVAGQKGVNFFQEGLQFLHKK